MGAIWTKSTSRQSSENRASRFWHVLYCIVLYLLPVLNPKSYDGARVLEASGRPILACIGTSFSHRVYSHSCIRSHSLDLIGTHLEESIAVISFFESLLLLEYTPPLVVSLRHVLSLSLFLYYDDYGSVITTPSRSFFYLMYTGIVLFIFIPLHIYPY